MNKKLLSIMLLAFVVMTGQAKEKVIVWEQPTTEYGIYGDGFFNLALDVTKVELKDNETVVYITAFQRGDSEKYDYWFQFVGDTYLKVGEQRYTLVSADNIELNKHVYPAKDGKRIWCSISRHCRKAPRRSTSSRATDKVLSKSRASSRWRNAGSSSSLLTGVTTRAIGR